MKLLFIATFFMTSICFAENFEGTYQVKSQACFSQHRPASCAGFTSDLVKISFLKEKGVIQMSQIHNQKEVYRQDLYNSKTDRPNENTLILSTLLIHSDLTTFDFNLNKNLHGQIEILTNSFKPLLDGEYKLTWEVLKKNNSDKWSQYFASDMILVKK